MSPFIANENIVGINQFQIIFLNNLFSLELCSQIIKNTQTIKFRCISISDINNIICHLFENIKNKLITLTIVFYITIVLILKTLYRLATTLYGETIISHHLMDERTFSNSIRSQNYYQIQGFSSNFNVQSYCQQLVKVSFDENRLRNNFNVIIILKYFIIRVRYFGFLLLLIYIRKCFASQIIYKFLHYNFQNIIIFSVHQIHLIIKNFIINFPSQIFFYEKQQKIIKKKLKQIMVRRTKSITEVIREAENQQNQTVDNTQNRGDLTRQSKRIIKSNLQKIPPMKKQIKKAVKQKEPIQNILKAESNKQKNKNFIPDNPIKNSRAKLKDLHKPKKAIVKNQYEQSTKQGSNKSDLSGVPIKRVDIVFVVDATCQKGTFLKRTIQCVNMLDLRIKELLKNDNVRFGFAAYLDNPIYENTWYTNLEVLCTNKQIISYIKTIDCKGGDHAAENALNALESVIEIVQGNKSRIRTLKYIFHICDKAPHCREFGEYREMWDKGCLCGKQADKIIRKMNVRQIHYKLIKASQTNLERFSKYFKDKVVNYDEVTIDSAEGMEIIISDMVIRGLQSQI